MVRKWDQNKLSLKFTFYFAFTSFHKNWTFRRMCRRILVDVWKDPVKLFSRQNISLTIHTIRFPFADMLQISRRLFSDPRWWIFVFMMKMIVISLLIFFTASVAETRRRAAWWAGDATGIFVAHLTKHPGEKKLPENNSGTKNWI